MVAGKKKPADQGEGRVRYLGMSEGGESVNDG